MKHFYVVHKRSLLQKKLLHFSEIFKIIRYTNVGKKTLNDFDDLNKKLDICINFKPFPSEILKKLSQSDKSINPVGAAFVTNGKSGTIYFDMNNEIGILCIQFIHEITHALDQNLWKLALDGNENKENIIFNAEQAAYGVQKEFINELLYIDPDYVNSLRKRFPDSNEIHTGLLSAEIAVKYGLVITN